MTSFDPNAATPENAGLFGLDVSAQDAWLHLVPVPWDVTTSYGKGTHLGPLAILKASHQVDLFDLSTKSPFLDGIYLGDLDGELMLANEQANAEAREGNAEAVNKYCTTMVNKVSAHCDQLLKAGRVVGVLGGDHSVPLGLIQALSKNHNSFGILHVDAHADLRSAFEGYTYSHASIMDNVLKTCPQVTKLVQVGIRDFCEEEFQKIENSNGRIETFFDDDLALSLSQGENWQTLCQKIIQALPEKVYISFDIDGLTPDLCPHTGTPVPGGLNFRDTKILLQELRNAGKKVIGFDLCEVAPESGRFEEHNNWDGNVGARVLYQLCHTVSRPLKR